MKTTKIKVGYSTSIPIAAYGIKDNAWAEIEIETNGEEPDFGKSLSDLKSKVDAWVRENYPQNYDATTKQLTAVCQPIPETQVERTVENRTQSIIQDIQSCKELKVLETYRIIAKSNPELQAAYDQTFKSLKK